MRNVSEGGARIVFAEHMVVPQTFELGISGREPRPARLVWHADGHAGVTFDCAGTVDLPTTSAPDALVTPSANGLESRIQAIISRRQLGYRSRA